jgi:hypothetical protein
MSAMSLAIQRDYQPTHIGMQMEDDIAPKIVWPNAEQAHT